MYMRQQALALNSLSLHSGPPSPNRAANKSTCSNQCIDHPGEGPCRAVNTPSLVFTAMSEKAVMMVSFSQVCNETEREREGEGTVGVCVHFQLNQLREKEID